MPRRMSGPSCTFAHLAQQDRHAAGADADGDLLQIIQALDVAAHAEDEFLLAHLERAPPTSPLLRWMAMLTSAMERLYARSLAGSTVTWYCFTKPAHGRDLGHTFNRRELILEVPVLHRAQFSQAAVGGVEAIHERPANTRGIRAKSRADILRQLRTEAAQVFEHPVRAQ